MKRAVVAAVGSVVAFGLGCASQKQEQKAQPVTQQVRITNRAVFDLESCFPTQLEVPQPVNTASLTGFLAAARPDIFECLVDPKNRGPAQDTTVNVQATVDDQGVSYAVSGDNLTPAGTTCVENAMKARTGLEPLPKGAAPVTAKSVTGHKVGADPAVTLGLNEINDVVGKVRLALPQWCDCFEPWKTAAPHSMTAHVELKKGSPTPTSVTFDQAPDETTAKVQSCLAQKIQALPLTTTSDELKVPVNILLIHSGISEPLPGTVDPTLALDQFDAIRAQSLSNAAILAGSRKTAADAYNALVDKYKANPKKVTVKDLKDKCQAMLSADDALLSALEGARDNEQKTLSFVQAQAAKDPRWQPTVQKSQEQLQGAEKDLQSYKQQRAKDADACPKVHY